MAAEALGAVRIMVPLVERENFEKNAPEWAGEGREGTWKVWGIPSTTAPELHRI